MENSGSTSGVINSSMKEAVRETYRRETNFFRYHQRKMGYPHYLAKVGKSAPAPSRVPATPSSTIA